MTTRMKSAVRSAAINAVAVGINVGSIVINVIASEALLACFLCAVAGFLMCWCGMVVIRCGGEIVDAARDEGRAASKEQTP